MKDIVDSLPAERALEPTGFANRKLIRPTLGRPDHNHSAPSAERRERGERPDRGGDRGDRGDRGMGRKTAPPEQTNAESFYFQKQMQSKTPVVVVLHDGEEVHGIIEWYDKNCIKVNRTGAPNLMIYKPSIKYIFKDEENGRK
ncbi:MAG TPA: RNA chaperone Hfq [Terriglobales bacterium]|nr:RNA chaperone Hfq [Terriglobales bacterium]